MAETFPVSWSLISGLRHLPLRPVAFQAEGPLVAIYFAFLGDREGLAVLPS